jgi:hypothetical protein
MCNDTEMIPIWYGMPEKEYIILARHDKVVLGGTRKKPYTHFCNKCQETYPLAED